jgi:hypothetical protein
MLCVRWAMVSTDQCPRSSRLSLIPDFQCFQTSVGILSSSYTVPIVVEHHQESHNYIQRVPRVRARLVLATASDSQSCSQLGRSVAHI